MRRTPFNCGPDVGGPRSEENNGNREPRRVLTIAGLEVAYGRSIQVLYGLSLRLEPRSIVALLGANGVGKSTTLKAISGVLKNEDGDIIGGSIRFADLDIGRHAPDRIVELGIVQVPEGRRLFADLTVEQNLQIGGCRRTRGEVRSSLEDVYQRFPHLIPKRKTAAGYLSGGEQQMVAIGRALMARPKVLLLDEPSLGLAPSIVEQLFESLSALRRADGLTILLVEQNATMALSIADRGYIMEGGRAVIEGSSAELRANEIVRQHYLGISSSGTRASFRRDPSTCCLQ
jgi:branched-chain amino acid transport system ATP-binding protein